MNGEIKEKVLAWMDNQIKQGNTIFDLEICVHDIGLDPLNKIDLNSVEEIFVWHKTMIDMILFDGIDENT